MTQQEIIEQIKAAKESENLPVVALLKKAAAQCTKK